MAEIGALRPTFPVGASSDSNKPTSTLWYAILDHIDYERMRDIFQSGHDPTDEEWKWVSWYLSLADKAFRESGGEPRTDKPPPEAEDE